MQRTFGMKKKTKSGWCRRARLEVVKFVQAIHECGACKYGRIVGVIEVRNMCTAMAALYKSEDQERLAWIVYHGL
jgi:hypothetical protein